MLRCLGLAAFFFTLVVTGSDWHWNNWFLILPAFGFVVFFCGFGVAIIEQDRRELRCLPH